MMMMESQPMILPVLALIAWSMILWVWMYATRLPAVVKMGMKMDPQARSGEQMAQLPAKVRWKAENYNHLMEQPTVFYALALSMTLLGIGDGINLVFAWAYVGLRVLHSLVHVTINNIVRQK